HEHATMHGHTLPENTLPMVAGEGPFGPIGMGGMFTVLKVRDTLPSDGDVGWYTNPPGTVAESIRKVSQQAPAAPTYVCPMHPEGRQRRPGSCPKCGMTLRAAWALAGKGDDDRRAHAANDKGRGRGAPPWGWGHWPRARAQPP